MRHQIRVTLILLLTLLAQLPAIAVASGHRIVVTNAAGNSVTFINTQSGEQFSVTVGTAPFGIAQGENNQAFVTTAEGIAIIDLRRRRFVTNIPYRAMIGRAEFGEYRSGGMGIAASRNGRYVYAGVYLGHRNSQLEVIDTNLKRVIASYPIGNRPFDVLLDEKRQRVYSVDHDSYSVTSINLTTNTVKTYHVAPLGLGSFDKPHFAALDPQGNLLLPIQGKALVSLNPVTGQTTHQALTANTHQHGVTLNRNADTLYIVGTGPAGSALGGPSLTLYNLRTKTERLLTLKKEHESVALSADERLAYLTGGQSFTGGWNGISIVNLITGNVRTIDVPNQPMGIIRIR